jgi:hypothetical protein
MFTLTQSRTLYTTASGCRAGGAGSKPSGTRTQRLATGCQGRLQVRIGAAWQEGTGEDFRRTNGELHGRCRLASGLEADPGLVGQPGNPLGRQHDRELTKHAGQAPGHHHPYPVHDNLAPGDLDAMDGNDGHHGHPASGRTRAAWSASQDAAPKAGARE